MKWVTETLGGECGNLFITWFYIDKIYIIDWFYSLHKKHSKRLVPNFKVSYKNRRSSNQLIAGMWVDSFDGTTRSAKIASSEKPSVKRITSLQVVYFGETCEWVNKGKVAKSEQVNSDFVTVNFVLTFGPLILKLIHLNKFHFFFYS